MVDKKVPPGMLNPLAKPLVISIKPLKHKDWLLLGVKIIIALPDILIIYTRNNNIKVQ